MVYRNTQTTAAAAEPVAQTATVRRGAITVSAPGAGSIIAANELVLSFDQSGTLDELLVGVGDTVQAGDVLARLDGTNAHDAVTQAEIQVAQARLNTNESAVAQGVAQAELALRRAELTVTDAQATLASLANWSADPADVAIAQADVDAAELSLSAARGSDSTRYNGVVQAEIDLNRALESADVAQENYDSAFDPARDWERNIDNARSNAEAALQRAQENLTLAQLSYNAAVAGVTTTSTANAELGLLRAQQALDTLLTPPTEQDIADALVAVDLATLDVTNATYNLEAAQTNTAAQLSLQQALLTLEQAERALVATTLIAPADGTILTISGGVGEQISGAFITLANLDQPLLETYLDEADLNNVGLGYEVDVVLDALPDNSYTGTVVEIDPQLVTVSGVQAIRALVQLDASAFAGPLRLPIGLNASVEVIGGRSQNTLLVPVEALREISPGEYAVFVMENGEPQLRFVEVGLLDFTFAEIVSGVAEGDIVSTGLIATNQ
jgi:multidrug resistance efflux pump